MSLESILQSLTSEGWSLDPNQVADLVSSPTPTRQEVLAAVLSTDLRKIFTPNKAIPDDVNRAVNGRLEGPVVFQVTGCEDITRPSKGVGGGGHPRLFRLRLTDGKTHCTAVEYAGLREAIPHELAPGTKVQLKGCAIASGILLLQSASNIKVLGGRVDELAEAFELAQKYKAFGGVKPPKVEGQGPPKFHVFNGKENADPRGGERERSGGSAAQPPAPQQQAQAPPPDQGRDKGGRRKGGRAGESAAHVTPPLASSEAPTPAPREQSARQGRGRGGRGQDQQQQQQQTAPSPAPPGISGPPPPRREGRSEGRGGRGGRGGPHGRNSHLTSSAAEFVYVPQPIPSEQPPAPAVPSSSSSTTAAPADKVKAKLLEKLDEKEREDMERKRNRGRGRRHRYEDDGADDGTLTLEEYERMRQGAGGLGVGAPASRVLPAGFETEEERRDREFAEQLQRELDEEAAREGGLAAAVRGMFNYQREEPEIGGRGFGRGRGGRGRGRR